MKGLAGVNEIALKKIDEDCNCLSWRAQADSDFRSKIRTHSEVVGSHDLKLSGFCAAQYPEAEGLLIMPADPTQAHAKTRPLVVAYARRCICSPQPRSGGALRQDRPRYGALLVHAEKNAQPRRSHLSASPKLDCLLCSDSDPRFLVSANFMSPEPIHLPTSQNVFVLGATGTIGRAAVSALAARGHKVVCFVRASAKANANLEAAGCELREGDVNSAESLTRDGFRGERFDSMVSCMASRTGAPKDAWAIDHRAHSLALAAARNAGVKHMVLLSAICVQKPLLAFQQAKLAFEKELVASGLTYSIVRPTAFFKSLSGQVERVKQGKPFLVFGNGQLTACKPISDADLAAYLARCLEDETLRNRVLPIGGPGDAITPLQQGEHLFKLLGRPARFKHVPVKLLDVVIKGLSVAGHLIPPLAAKAEMARIGRYYATESMLVLNSETGHYDALATPSTGAQTLFDYYENLVRGNAKAERGEHAVF